MKKRIEIRLAWAAWHLLVKINDKIWDHYEKDFIDIIIGEIEKEESMTFGNRSDDFIPF